MNLPLYSWSLRSLCTQTVVPLHGLNSISFVFQKEHMLLLSNHIMDRIFCYKHKYLEVERNICIMVSAEQIDNIYSLHNHPLNFFLSFKIFFMYLFDRDGEKLRERRGMDRQRRRDSNTVSLLVKLFPLQMRNRQMFESGYFCIAAYVLNQVCHHRVTKTKLFTELILQKFLITGFFSYCCWYIMVVNLILAKTEYALYSRKSF